MIVADFTESEIKQLLLMCNFTDTERELFLLRARNISLVECSIKMNMSLDGIKKLSRKVNKKIIRSI